ncbi:MAG: hypothetical protein JSW73_04950 [Candidatus Woesearchaeota archaeon]|nr:MAG: hypothetical protein JSW73_04950 [Candidatus Woesearchaeota archaeon]
MKHISRELGYIASAAPFLLVAAVLPTVTQTFSGSGAVQAIGWINMIFVIIAFILVLIGAITMAITIFSKLKP